MPFYYNGDLISGPRGPAGPDGNPIGTVISFLGADAPKDYLACDGTAYNISDYPELAALFAEQFGSASHFGGDGETTFAIPDMRNLFLRGYHGEAEEQLSGEVGIKQPGTIFPYMGANYSSIYSGYDLSSKNKDYVIKNTDTVGPIVGNRYVFFESNGSLNVPAECTARPVNMAVLFCIKAVESVKKSGLEEYDTEDGWHVRKWSDGYVEMNAEVVQQAGIWHTMNNGFYYSDELPAPEFPFPLTTKYEESVSHSDIPAASGALTHFASTMATAGSLTKPRLYWLICTQTDISGFGMRYHVTGRWK